MSGIGAQGINGSTDGARWRRPAPSGHPLEQPFWDAARNERLVVQHCRACDDLRFPPSPACPKCLSSDQDWVEVSGQASLESWTTFHKAYWPDLVPGVPYRVCLARLSEGPLIISNLVGVEDEMHIGMPLKAGFMPCEGFVLPIFVRGQA